MHSSPMRKCSQTPFITQKVSFLQSSEVCQAQVIEAQPLRSGSTNFTYSGWMKKVWKGGGGEVMIEYVNGEQRCVASWPAEMAGRTVAGTVCWQGGCQSRQWLAGQWLAGQ